MGVKSRLVRLVRQHIYIIILREGEVLYTEKTADEHEWERMNDRGC